MIIMQHLMPLIGTMTLAYKIDAAQYQGSSQEQKKEKERVQFSETEHPVHLVAGGPHFLSVLAKWL